MEDKIFDNDRVPVAEEKTPATGHNKRHRRKKSGTRQTAAVKGEQPSEERAEDPNAAQKPSEKAEEAPSVSAQGQKPEESAPEKPEEKTPEEQSEKQPEERKEEPAVSHTEEEKPEEKAEDLSGERTAETPEPESPEEPETPESPESPESPEAPESPESADTAESAEPAEDVPEPEDKADEPAPPAEEGKTTETEDRQEDASEEEAETPEQKRRAAEMTRTVQLSIEKIVENIEEAVEAEETETYEGDPEEDAAREVPLTRLQQLHQTVGDGAWALLKWLAFVLAFVAVVAGAGIAWLYKGATPDSIPQVSAVFNGQELQATSYSWHVPVVANVFKRTYADTVSKDPVQIEETVQTAQVDLDVKHTSCDTLLTLENSAGEEVFEGTAEEFGNYTFTQNDTYSAELVVFRNEKQVSHTAEVSGRQTYLFTFTVSLRPSIRLNTVSTTQGGVAAVRVSGGAADEAGPVLTTELNATAFRQGESGWVCYLPIPVDQEPGMYTVSVSYAGYTQELTLTVKARSNVYKDYSYKSQLTSPYISEEDTPAEVLAVLDQGSETAAWAEEGFAVPFTGKAEVELAYGTTEYVGRTRSERAAGTGTGRISTNMVVSTTRGGDLLAPAAGTVLLAEDLGDTAGYTIVIDHGAGVKSIFYCLRSVSVKAGDTVKAEQLIGETNRTTIGEVRVGDVPVEPLAIWRGECDALHHY